MRIGLILLAVILFMALIGSEAEAYPPPPANYQISSPFPQLQNEEQVWVSPVDSNIVISLWRDFRLGYRRVAVGRSTDAGNTWTDSLVTVRRDYYQSDPCVDVNAEGRFFLGFLDFGNFGSAISVISSDDAGISFGNLTVITAPYNYSEDKQFMTVDRTGGVYDGNLYMAWMRFCGDISCNAVYFARLQNDGFFFDTPVLIGPPPDLSNCGTSTSFAGQFPQPLVGSDGSIYVFWNYYDTTDCTQFYTIHMVKSTDGGLTFTSPKKLVNTFGNFQFVDGGIDVYNMPVSTSDIFGGPYYGNIYIAYANIDTTNTEYYDYNIEFIKSSDGGDNWTEPICINDDYIGPGATFDQFHPWLFCNEEGILIAIFYDQRLDTLDHYKFDVFAAYSFDGGESFTTNQRITSVSSSPSQAKDDDLYQAGPPWTAQPVPPLSWPDGDKDDTRAGKIAEYIGVTAYHDHVNAVWTDTRNGNQDVFGANWPLPILEPRLLSPENCSNVSIAYPHLNWAAAWKSADDQYRVEVATDNQFANIVFTEYSDSAGLVSSTNALPDSLYYWRVKAFKLSTGDSTEYSKVWSFTVGDFVCVDSDGDGYGDPDVPGSTCLVDNCPYVYNPDQADVDDDLVGDSCDNCNNDLNTGQEDSDSDGVGDVCDNCIDYPNIEQTDMDADGVGDACDNCPEVYNPDQSDSNGNDIGDACDYICGDADGNVAVNILDVTFLINYIYKGGQAPNPLNSADADGNGAINLLDITYLIKYLYKGGAAPIC
ncbi:MAG: hypothetical protein CVT49_13445 [candidate division Zixibacteria bacterium HGW-Zixibacteria-1]|nr:MAG: hypothetical protein CVT49_13445 [candidate division Zixibacteria bacterium HGW-Zixibacteria-1]